MKPSTTQIISQTADIDVGCCTPTPAEASVFLSEYASLLFGCGATCIRLRKNVTRIASALGMKVEMSLLPRHIHLTVADRCSGVVVQTATPVAEHAISFDINTRLSKLSWALADHTLSFGQACRRFEEIKATKGANPWMVLMLASVANASFCRLFGGDAVAMTIVFVATFAGFYIKQLLMARKVDMRVTVLICSFISSVLAAADGLFVLGTTPDIAIGTSILYLVPGIPFINSFCDMLDKHYICSFVRLMNALMLTCALSIGLYVGMMLMNVKPF